MGHKASRGGGQHYVTLTPVIDTAVYATGELIGTKLELEGAVAGETGQAAQLAGIIQSVIITDLAKQSADIDVVFFDEDPSNTTFTDNAAFDIDDADLLKVVGVVSVTVWKGWSDNSSGQSLQLALPFILETGFTLYAALVSRGTPTYGATSDLTLRVGVLAS